MKHKVKLLYIFVSLLIVSTLVMNACKTPEAISMKSGAELWGENCNRCHNAPDPSTYSDDQWEVIVEHMRQKALLTDTEMTKIREFMTVANRHF